MAGFKDRLSHAWNAFINGDSKSKAVDNGKGWASMGRPDRVRMSHGVERTITAALYNRIAIDVSAIPVKHVRLDENGIYKDDIKGRLQDRFTLEANLDQTGRAFMQDVVMSLFDEGCVAIVPVTTSIDPSVSGSYEIDSLRVGRVVQWFPAHVRVNLYNEETGFREDVIVPKASTAIIENPLYIIMNEPNSTLKRLVNKLNLLDVVDNQSGSGKLDLILQLPYTIKSESRREQAEKRRKDIEGQLTNSKYGIAYTDGTERITQLNRPAENNLMHQIEYLTNLLYSQLGVTQNIFNGTANEQESLNYYAMTIEPVVSAIVDECRRKFLTKTARSQGQTLVAIRDPFRLVSVDKLSEAADKFTRNEILTSNEFRGVIGFKPSEDPAANQLRNKNLNQPAAPGGAPEEGADGAAPQDPKDEYIAQLEGIIENME